MTIRTTELDTPLGAVTAAEHDGTLVGLAFTDSFDGDAIARRFPDDDVEAVADLPSAAVVRAYFDGDLNAIDDIDTDLGGTEFQREVWTTLRTIPAGETWSYAQLAEAVGRPKAFRAVGAANGSNPVWLVHPCHRVIAANGTLGGYGGGLERKAWLLRHEGALLT